MPTPTYTPLANLTLASTTATITFSSIPATYRDLVIVVNGTVTVAAAQPTIRFNSDAGSNYSQVYMAGNGTSTSAGSATLTWGARSVNFSTTNRGSIIYNIFDYAETNKHKSFLSRGNEAGSDVIATTLRWANPSAITSIALAPETGSSWASGCTFALYGIAA